MKTYIASDLHWDDWKGDCKTAKGYLEGWQIPMSKHFEADDHSPALAPADCIIVAGDIANSYESWCEMVKELSRHYKEVVLVLGNHDLTCAWGDQYRFENTQDKIGAYKKYVKYYPNVHLLDGEVITIGDTKIGGCMGMWDLSFIRGGYFNTFYPDDTIAWRTVNKQWNHWFDSHYWKYMNNNITLIRDFELAKITKCLEQKPDIMVTHFCPFPGESNLPRDYWRSANFSFFYFDNKFTSDVKLWIAGHTHTPYYKVGPNENIIVNPIGYFGENDNEAAKADKWFIELEKEIHSISI